MNMSSLSNESYEKKAKKNAFVAVNIVAVKRRVKLVVVIAVVGDQPILERDAELARFVSTGDML